MEYILSPARTLTRTPTGRVRSVPKLVFTDAEAGALEFPSSNSRSFNYFEPQRLRATMYEDVTVDVQPDPARHLTQDWLYGFAKGPGGYPTEWTAAKSSDWHWFRDPNQEWEQTIYKNNARLVRQVEQNIANARNEGAFEQWSPRWSKIVERHVGAWMHPEHGLGMHVFLPAQRDAPTNMINNAISVNSMHKLRIAQDLALFNLEASEARSDFDGKAHLETWNRDPIWQPVRENAEKLTAIRDWLEAVIAANLAFEPLVGELFRAGFVMATAAANGDFVTPTIMGVAESDLARDLSYTKDLVGGLTRDQEHGKHNIELFGEWLSRWIPESLQAARALAPVFSEVENSPVTFEDALARARERVREILDELDVPTPKELDQAPPTPTGLGEAVVQRSTGDVESSPPHRYLRVRAPERVPLRDICPVQARIDTDMGGVSRRLLPFDVPPQGVDVRLVVHCRTLTSTAPLQRVVHLPPAGPSPWALFELRADAEGIHTVTVIAFVDGTSVGDLEVQVTAEAGVSGGSTVDHTEDLDSLESRPGDVSLIIHYDQSRQKYRFQLFDVDEPEEEDDSLPLTDTPKAAVEGLVHQLNQVARDSSPFGPSETRKWLRAHGIALWESFIPKALRRQFWERRDRISSLTIISSDDPVPWELLYPLSATRDEGFLAEIPILRWSYGGRRARILPTQPVAFVLPDDSPPRAAGEVRRVGELLGGDSSHPIRDLMRLLNLLEEPDFGVLHLACHNTFRADQPDTTEVMLSGGPFQPTFLSELKETKGLQRRHPLIFMNACRSAGAAPLYTHLLGWANNFVEAGAGAFIGSQWAVRDETALLFAEAFYCAMRDDRQTLGESLVTAREAIRDVPGDPTWLAYTAYGLPGAKLE